MEGVGLSEEEVREEKKKWETREQESKMNDVRARSEMKGMERMNR